MAGRFAASAIQTSSSPSESPAQCPPRRINFTPLFLSAARVLPAGILASRFAFVLIATFAGAIMLR